MEDQHAPTPPADDEIKQFYDQLRQHASGQSNAKTARQLVRLLNLGRNGDRRLRQLANAATESGMLVCTGNAGYWLPATEQEAEETIGRLHSQGIKMLERARELRVLVSRQFATGQQIGMGL